MTNNFLSIYEVIRHARNQQNSTNSLPVALGIYQGNRELHAKHFPFSVLMYNMALLPFQQLTYAGTDSKGATSELVNRIKADPPSIVCLCEVFTGFHKYNIRELFGLSQIYRYCIGGPDELNPGFQYKSDGGLLVQSKDPFLAHHTSIYRQCAGSDCLANKGMIHIRVRPSNSPTAWDIFFSHTQNIEEDGGKETLYNQLSHLGDFVKAYTDPLTPTLIMGDLNIPAEAKVHYSQLIRRLGNPIDLWLLRHSSGSGFTNTTDNNFYKDSADAPSQSHRLDYILMKAGLQFIPILKYIQLLKWTHNGRQISDHFGLRAIFEQHLKIGINISGVIHSVAVSIIGFRCIQTTFGFGSDEVSFTVRLWNQYGIYAEMDTPIIEDVDTYEYHQMPNINPPILQGDPGSYIKIEVEGREHGGLLGWGTDNLGKESIFISRKDLLLNKGRSFNLVMPFLEPSGGYKGEYAVHLKVSIT